MCRPLKRQIPIAVTTALLLTVIPGTLVPAPAAAATVALSSSSVLGKLITARSAQTLRTAPAAGAASAGAVRAGESLRLLDSTVGWVRVAGSQGQIGWLSGSTVRMTDPDLPFWAGPAYQIEPGSWRASLYPTRAVGSWLKSAPIRSGASPTAPVVAQAKGGEVLHLLSIPAGDFVPVLTGNEVQGWINRYDLMISSSLARTEEALLTQIAPDRFRLEVRGAIGTFGLQNGAFQVGLPMEVYRRGNLAVKTAGVERLRWEPTGLVVPLTGTFAFSVVSQGATNLVVELGPVSVSPPTPTPIPAPQLPLTGRTIVVDPGHGGEEPGAISNGLVEKLINLEMAQRTKAKLEAEGARVVLTRTGDERCGAPSIYAGQDAYTRGRTDLACRAALAAQAKADLFLSIHFNALDGTTAGGTETFWSFEAAQIPASQRLAGLLQRELVSAIGLTNRGVKSDNFYVITHADAPAALVEIGFISSPTEAAYLNQAATKEKAAAGLTKGVKAYFE